MILLRSTFWLAVAYFAIGPQLDISAKVDELSVQAMNAGQQVIAERVNATQCSSIECFGTKLAVSASLNAPPEIANGFSLDQNPEPILIAPVPQPRLVRTV